MRAGIYVRISKDRESEERGVRRQETDCRKLAKARGWTVVDLYSDNDVSATSGRRRPAWEQLLEDLEAGKLDAVIAYSSSRMYRRPRDLQKLIDLLQKRPSTEIATVVSGKVDLSTADGRMLTGILAQIDQGEAERIGERVRRKMDERAQEGKRNGGRRPFGYTDALEVDEAEAAVVRSGAHLVLSGASVHRVAAEWNAAGSTTPTGKRWTVRGVRAILTSALIAGLREHRREGKLLGVYPGTWPAILTEEDHARLRRLLPLRPGNGKPAPRRHPLSNLLACGECGTGLTGRTQPDGRRSYWCSPTVGGCGKVAIGANAAEDLVLDAVQESDPDYKLKRRLTAVPPVDPRALADLAGKRAILQRAADLGANVRDALARVEEGEAALWGRPTTGHPTDPEKDDPGRRDRRHAGKLTEEEVVQSRDWVAAWVDRAVVRRASSTREPAADRIAISWRP